MDEYSDNEEDRLRRAEFTARVLSRLHREVVPCALVRWPATPRTPAPPPVPKINGRHLWQVGNPSKEARAEVRAQLVASGAILPSASKTSESKAPYTLKDARSDRDRWLDNARKLGGR